MAQQKPDWFKVNPSQFLSDSQVEAMSTEELGACFRLLCRQWIDGWIPDDLHLLSRLARLDATAMGQAWVTLCHFFPVLEEGKRANRYMWVERDKVLSEMDRKSDEGSRAARKRWDEVRKKRDTSPNGSPMPHPMGQAMQERESESEIEERARLESASNPKPKSRRRRSAKEITMEFSRETQLVVNTLASEWPREQPDGGAIQVDISAFAQAVEAILAMKNPAITPDVLVEAGRMHFAKGRKAWKAPQWYFSIADKNTELWPWIGDARMAYRKLHPHTPEAVHA